MELTYVELTNNDRAVTGWPLGATRFFLYDETEACAVVVARVAQMSSPLQVSITTPAIPTPPTGEEWVDRTCGPVVNTDVQPTVVTPYPDVTFNTAGQHTIQIPAGTFAGGGLSWSATRGDNDPLRDGITFNAATRTYTLPAGLTDEYYILRTVATNSVGSVADVFAVRLTYNTTVVTPPNSDLTTPVTYTGAKVGGYPSNDPALLDIQYDFVDGRIRNLRNGSSPSLSGNQMHVFKLGNSLYKYQNGQWFAINPTTGSVSGTATDLNLSPQMGHLFQYFRVDANRPLYGSDNVPGWFDQPVDNASQLLRIL